MISGFWHDSRLMSIIAGLFTLTSFLVFSIAIVHWLIHRPVFDLRQMILDEQSDPVNVVSFQNQVLPKIKGGFFSVDLHKVRMIVESQSWVRKAVVQRSWPNALRIKVEAHKPLAFWGDGRLVNTYGEVFAANLAEATAQRELARLEGPPGSELLVSKMYVDAGRSLAQIGMHPNKVLLSDRYGWTFETVNGIRIELGREQEELGIEDKLVRLKRVFGALKENLMEQIEVIDMRYPRGLAVKGQRIQVAS